MVIKFLVGTLNHDYICLSKAFGPTYMGNIFRVVQVFLKYVYIIYLVSFHAILSATASPIKWLYKEMCSVDDCLSDEHMSHQDFSRC